MKGGAMTHDESRFERKPSSMNPAQKALWYIESHLAQPLTLDEISRRSAASRASTWCGRSPRRPDFRSCVMCAPGVSARPRAHLPAARPTFSASRWMRTTALTKHSPARSATISGSRPRWSAPRRAWINSSFRSRSRWIQPRSTISSRRVSKPASRCSSPASASALPTTTAGAGIPNQWQRFHQSVDNIPGRIGKVAYGVCCNGDDAGNFDYIAGVEVSDFSDLPREFSRVQDSSAEIRGVHPLRAHLDHSPHRQHDLESLAADIRDEGRRRAELRALRREVRFRSPAMVGSKSGVAGLRMGTLRETHRPFALQLMGFASLYPSYGPRSPQGCPAPPVPPLLLGKR